jgi:hypothetical protein
MTGMGASTEAEMKLKGWQEPDKHFMIYDGA